MKNGSQAVKPFFKKSWMLPYRPAGITFDDPPGHGHLVYLVGTVIDPGRPFMPVKE
jgi:hypothetical protein